MANASGFIQRVMLPISGAEADTVDRAGARVIAASYFAAGNVVGSIITRKRLQAKLGESVSEVPPLLKVLY